MTPTTSVLPDPASDQGRRFRHRLATDLSAWLTVVSESGTPHPTPVWFLWDDETEQAVTYCPSNARRLDWIASNDRASLHVNDGDGEGHDWVLLSGRLRRLGPDYPAPEANPPFVAKYRWLMEEIFGEPVGYARAFGVPLLFTAHRARGH